MAGINKEGPVKSLRKLSNLGISTVYQEITPLP